MSIKSKKQLVKKDIIDRHGCLGQTCSKCTKTLKFIDLMEESNIPMGYWFLKIKNFYEAGQLKKIVEDYIVNLKKNYIDGKSICFAGNQGTGKTMSSILILKAALKKGLSVYYTTASDILNEMTDTRYSNDLRYKLRSVDFLAIDELDSRFFASNATKELFSGIYENIFRFRSHNTLPTIICTNETSGILNVFYGMGAASIDSLNAQYLNIYPIAGIDVRKNKNDS